MRTDRERYLQSMLFEFGEQWKERLVYREDGKEFSFDGAWGVEPHIVYVPTADYWRRATPEWMRDRRAEVLARFRAYAGTRYTVEETATGYSDAGKPQIRIFAASSGDSPPGGAWIAVLVDPAEDGLPEASWSEQDQTRFLSRHAGRWGRGQTPAAAIENLKDRQG